MASFVAILDKDLTDRRKAAEQDIEPFLSASYASLVSEELRRRLKAVPVAFYEQPPTKLFDANAAADWLGWDLGG